ncbi:MAG TPA: alginate export family protein [Marinagarivorans sp.]|nr:alginate export family protein [Cellvibrionaceae bacterium]HMY38010.1 alginate export family protein [Marinagarivorans sp.]HNG58950.1 alginate export family protein [Cellvibrionaceae bacterium]
MSSFPFPKSLLCALITCAPMTTYAGEDAFYDALSGGKASGNFRLRYESVDVTSPTVKDAEALTLRSRLGYETAPLAGFTAMAEFEDTRIIGAFDEYAPNKAGFAAIVDPEQTELNQAFVRYRGISKLDVIAGRQKILLDNQRFVGNVGWRQNEQTFDALTLNYKGISDWSFYYAYIGAVQGIAKIKPNTNFSFDTDDHLLNIQYSGFQLGKITAYAYLLNNQALDLNQLNPALRYQANDTLGLRFDGAYVMPTTLPLRLLYTAEYAQQTLTNPALVEKDMDYYYLDLGIAYTTKQGPLVFKVYEESLGSDKGTQGFQTPYATKHAFEGWADMFLGTPTTGVVYDTATLSMDMTALGIKWLINYGTYKQDEGNKDFGDEINAQVLKAFGKKYTIGLKYADYSADKAIATINPVTPNIDTKKVWLWGEMAF